MPPAAHPGQPSEQPAQSPGFVAELDHVPRWPASRGQFPARADQQRRFAGAVGARRLRPAPSVGRSPRAPASPAARPRLVERRTPPAACGGSRRGWCDGGRAGGQPGSPWAHGDRAERAAGTSPTVEDMLGDEVPAAGKKQPHSDTPANLHDQPLVRQRAAGADGSRSCPGRSGTPSVGDSLEKMHPEILLSLALRVPEHRPLHGPDGRCRRALDRVADLDAARAARTGGRPGEKWTATLGLAWRTRSAVMAVSRPAADPVAAQGAGKTTTGKERVKAGQRPGRPANDHPPADGSCAPRRRNASPVAGIWNVAPGLEPRARRRPGAPARSQRRLARRPPARSGCRCPGERWPAPRVQGPSRVSRNVPDPALAQQHVVAAAGPQRMVRNLELGRCRRPWPAPAPA